jgi:hypothetical protein
MTVSDWILLLQIVGILAVFAYAAARCPVIRRAARDLAPGWDDEDLARALHKKRQAKPHEFVSLTNRELQALRAMEPWPK